MIDLALSFLQDQVNSYVKNITGSNSNKVILSNVVDSNANGAMAIATDTVGMTLVNVEEERTIKDQNYMRKSQDGVVSKINPEIRLNLYILFAANPSSGNYIDGLKLLSHVITYFQGNSTFDPTSYPTLDPRVQKVILDLYTMPLEQQHYLWSALGAKYLPSTIYKVRLITVQLANASASSPSVFQIQTNLQQS